MLHLRPATLTDAARLAPNLRKADQEECEAAHGRSPQVILPLSILISTQVTTAVDKDGELVGCFGVAPGGLSSVGLVWMVATDRLVRHRTWFLRQSKAALAELHDLYPTLTNVVDARNELHIKWLRWLGFKRLGVITVGPRGLPFIEFARMKPVHV